MSRQKRITEWVERWLTSQNRPSDAAIEPLAGDGSLRCYYRLRLPDTTYVLLADALWTSSKDYAPHQAYLTARQVPVPRFLAVDAEAGLAVMEDLGDELLQERLRKVSADSRQKQQWMRAAVELLGKLHGQTYPVPKELPVSTRRFDTAKYTEELLFTFEHLHHQYLGFPPATSRQIEAVREFCASLDRMTPDVFCHRDYHTRNLLVFHEQLFMIDFQDARLGPAQYDLASLLYDAYVPVSEEERRELCGYYKESLRPYSLFQAMDWNAFDTGLRRVAFQRVVKAAGSFASFYSRYRKTTHLPYLLPALRSAQQLQAQCLGPQDHIGEAMDIGAWIQRATEMGLN